MPRHPTRNNTARHAATGEPRDAATDKVRLSWRSGFHTSREIDPEYTRRIEKAIRISSKRTSQVDDLTNDAAQPVESLSTTLTRVRESLDRVQGATS